MLRLNACIWSVIVLMDCGNVYIAFLYSNKFTYFLLYIRKQIIVFLVFQETAFLFWLKTFSPLK